MTPLWAAGSFGLMLCFLAAGLWVGHVRGFRLGRNLGWRDGELEGYRKGFAAGKNAFWFEAEKAIDREMERMRDEPRSGRFL